MNPNNLEIQILNKNLSACSERVDSLVYSINKNKPIFPLVIVVLDSLSEDQKESIDALILRYNQCVSMIQEPIFRGIALAEQEDVNDKSNRYKAELMEKFGVIKSASEFGTAAVLRNKFSHHYPEESKDQLDKLNLLIEEGEFVVQMFDQIVEYVTVHGFAKADNAWGGHAEKITRNTFHP